jgi:hypothetical protein
MLGHEFCYSGNDPLAFSEYKTHFRELLHFSARPGGPNYMVKVGQAGIANPS